MYRTYHYLDEPCLKGRVHDNLCLRYPLSSAVYQRLQAAFDSEEPLLTEEEAAVMKRLLLMFGEK